MDTPSFETTLTTEISKTETTHQKTTRRDLTTNTVINPLEWVVDIEEISVMEPLNRAVIIEETEHDNIFQSSGDYEMNESFIYDIPIVKIQDQYFEDDEFPEIIETSFVNDLSAFSKSAPSIIAGA